MNRTIMFIIFFMIFLSIYFSLNLYVYFRLTNMFNINRSIYLYSALVALAVSFPLASVLEHYFNNFLVRGFYIISSIWSGMLFIMFTVLLVHQLLALFIKNPVFDYAMVGIALFLALFAIINALNTNVRSIEVTIEGLDKDIKLVQLSDLHIGTVRNSKFLQSVVFKVNQLEPDIVVITGDLVDGSGKYHAESFKVLSKLKAKTYFVTGNHEFYVGIEDVMKILNKTNMKILRNESIMYNGLQIIGIDDAGETRNHPNLKMKVSKPAILLRHQPILVEEAEKAGIDLQLSGHTHDGQIFPFNFLVRTSFKYIGGMYEIGKMKLYVSPGTGTWGPPMRLGSKNEITVFNLTSN